MNDNLERGEWQVRKRQFHLPFILVMIASRRMSVFRPPKAPCRRYQIITPVPQALGWLEMARCIDHNNHDYNNEGIFQDLTYWCLAFRFTKDFVITLASP
jgi:hypothetical protein